MPFAYYGAKHNLARYMAGPLFDTIIEPFAGSAAYATRWASLGHRVILIEKDPAVVQLWRDLQQMTAQDVFDIGDQMNNERVTHPFLGSLCGATSLRATLEGRDRQVTPRMLTDWPAVRDRIIAALPRVKHWEIIEGDYTDAPDIEATWLIDPPYQPLIEYKSGDGAGNGYRFPTIDYDALGAWCQTRQGQVMVCEQAPAAWLPFEHFQSQQNAVAGDAGEVRSEVMWLGGVNATPSLFD